MYITDRNLIYDVGMHKGEDTAFYLKKGFRVVAFEADPDLIAEAKVKFSQELNEGNLTLVEGAIIDPANTNQESIAFYKNKGITDWGTLLQDWSKRNERMGQPSEVIEVNTVDFEKCLRQYGMPYYLKIDIEGMDTVCLHALASFSHKPTYLSIESNKVSYTALKAEFELLAALGYQDFQLVNQEDVPYQQVPLDTAEGKHAKHTFTYGSSGLFGLDLAAHKWVDKKNALSKYKWVFAEYWLWGDKSRIKRLLLVRFIQQRLEQKRGRKVPGWYDTHAKRGNG